MSLLKKAALDLPRAFLPYVDRLFVQLHVVASFLNLTFAPYEFPAAASVNSGLVRHSCGNSNLIHLRYQCHSKSYYNRNSPGLQGFSEKYCSFSKTIIRCLLYWMSVVGRRICGTVNWVQSLEFLHLSPTRSGQQRKAGHAAGLFPVLFAFIPYAQRAATGSGGIRRAYSRLFCICPLSLKNCQPGRPTGKNQPAVLHRQADLICLYAAGKCPTCSGTGIIFCCITDAPGAAFLQHC